MVNSFFGSIFENNGGDILFTEFLICFVGALVVGYLFSVLWSLKSNYTKSFIVSLALIPSCVALIIMLVNGNLGTGIAIAGAFGLVRYRSLPGTAKEICGMFISMTIGFAFGVGYVFYGILFAIY